nr:hypothetical protein [Cyanidioschyzonaceae sp. 3]WDB00412.1 hypothetical protein CCYA8123_100 [Cyanidiococcus yangmingshanensis]
MWLKLLWWSDGMWTQHWNLPLQPPLHQYLSTSTIQRCMWFQDHMGAISVIATPFSTHMHSNLGIQMQHRGLHKGEIQQQQQWIRIYTVFDETNGMAIVSEFYV